MTHHLEQAHAKLTLFLHLLGKRPSDGYHLLDALVVFTKLCDELVGECLPSPELTLKVSGDYAQSLSPAPDNLVLRAARLMQSHFSITQGIAFTLEKRIPVAAGLGGGSADAAAALRLLNRLWEIHAPLEALEPLAAQLGSDVPACLHQKPLRMQGVGEQITLMSSKQAQLQGTLLLINPRQSLLTASVYQACQPPAPPIAPPELLPHWREARNDLQPAAMALCPEISEVIDWLRDQEGCQIARLCGSGATCFGWFDDAQAARFASQRTAQHMPHWWHALTALN